MLVAFLALVTTEPTLEQAQTCQAHMELLIEDVMREGGLVAGPTWFIRDWWDRQAQAAGAPDGHAASVAARKTELERHRTANPDDFQAGRGACVDAAMDAGAAPGMMRVRPQ